MWFVTGDSVVTRCYQVVSQLQGVLKFYSQVNQNMIRLILDMWKCRKHNSVIAAQFLGTCCMCHGMMVLTMVSISTIQYYSCNMAPTSQQIKTTQQCSLVLKFKFHSYEIGYNSHFDIEDSGQLSLFQYKCLWPWSVLISHNWHQKLYIWQGDGSTQR